MSSKDAPERERERLRQKELKNNTLGSLNEGLKRSENGNLADFSGGMGWKATGLTILVLIIGFIIFTAVFR